jgi:hypothetical protein
MVQTIQREFRNRSSENDGDVAKSLATTRCRQSLMRSAARCACLNIFSIRRLFEEGKQQAELEVCGSTKSEPGAIWSVSGAVFAVIITIVVRLIRTGG